MTCLADWNEGSGKVDHRASAIIDGRHSQSRHPGSLGSQTFMFTASDSRHTASAALPVISMSFVPVIQSFAQLEKQYGREGAEIIVDNIQLTLFGGFAPNSESAKKLSGSLGSATVQSGTVTRNGKEGSLSLSMLERPLLTPDELKQMPKGTFIVEKTGRPPLRMKLKLFTEWGIRLESSELPKKPPVRAGFIDYRELKRKLKERYNRLFPTPAPSAGHGYGARRTDVKTEKRTGTASGNL